MTVPPCALRQRQTRMSPGASNDAPWLIRATGLERPRHASSAHCPGMRSGASLMQSTLPGGASMHDIVIRGGSVIDGSGRPAFTADVAIDGGRIAAVGG